MTIREWLNTGSKEGYRLAWKMLKVYYGKVPLCRVEVKTRKSSLGRISTWIKCSWLKRWYTEKVFRRRCLICQEEMLRTLRD